MNRFFFIFIFLSTTLCGQNFNNELNEIEKGILSYNNKVALEKIDSLLVDNYETLTSSDKRSLEILKIEALTKANLFAESLMLSLVLLQETDLQPQQRIRILVNNALAYECTSEFEECNVTLDEVESIYNNGQVKDALYARYLNRRSSFYRVQRKFDDLALFYAEKAKEFAVKNGYKSESAVASMILGFLYHKENSSLAKKHFNVALSFWKEVDDQNGVSSMYIALSEVAFLEKDIDKALSLCEKAIELEKDSDRYGYLSYAFTKKSKILEQTGRLDSAIVALKEKYRYLEKDNSLKQEIKVNEVKFDHDIKMAKLKNEDLSNALNKQKVQQNVLVVALLTLVVVGGITALLNYRLQTRNKEIKNQRGLLKQSLQEKSVLLKELHHRVKNNLAMILSLIKLQENTSQDGECKKVLKKLESRVETIAIAHNQFLYSENNDKYCLDTYIKTIADNLINLSLRPVKIDYDLDDTIVSIDSALPLGIIVNELITNSIKHADVQDELVLTISIKIENNNILMNYHDNGKLGVIDGAANSLGLVIIQAMTKQLRGSYKKDGFKYNFSLLLK